LILLLHDRALLPDHGEPITLTLTLGDFDDDLTKFVGQTRQTPILMSFEMSRTNKTHGLLDGIEGNEIGMATPDYTPPRQRPLINSRQTKGTDKCAPQQLSRKGCYNARKWCEW
jgi:hypothetical protein